jgi:hypothetical protein
MMSRYDDISKSGKHTLTNHVLFIYISATFLANVGVRYQAFDAVMYQASFPGCS